VDLVADVDAKDEEDVGESEHHQPRADGLGVEVGGDQPGGGQQQHVRHQVQHRHHEHPCARPEEDNASGEEVEKALQTFLKRLSKLWDMYDTI
jgi:hypothetical protein